MQQVKKILDLFNRRKPLFGDLLCLGFGLLMPLSFAPFEWRWVPFLSLAGFLLLLQDLPLKKTLLRGFLYGFSMFGLGVSWIYNSLHDFGSASVFVSVLLTVAMVCANSACVVGGLWLFVKYRRTSIAFNAMLLFPAAWVGAEWLRSWILTGFPWILSGYSQVDTALSGYAPMAGVLAVGFCVSVIAGALVVLLLGGRRQQMLALMIIPSIFLGGLILQQLTWVRPTGDTVRASLIQGNIPQELKLKPEQLAFNINHYQQLSRGRYDSDLIVWPETAVPDFRHRVDEVLQPFYAELQQNGVELISGIFIYDFERRLYYNSLYKVGTEETYHKQHLVPFGEYMPLRGLLEFMNRFINIPMSDIAPADNVGLMSAAGHTAGVSICYESAYASIFRRQLPQAEFFINASNDAWFGDSLAPHQHLEIARIRALESGRYLLRATNNGISAIIGADGKVLARSPQFREYVVTGEIRMMAGITPYAVTGNWLIMPLLGLIFLFAALYGRKNQT